MSQSKDGSPPCCLMPATPVLRLSFLKRSKLKRGQLTSPHLTSAQPCSYSLQKGHVCHCRQISSEASFTENRKNILAVELRSVFVSLSTIMKYLEIISYIQDHLLVTTWGHLENNMLWATICWPFYSSYWWSSPIPCGHHALHWTQHNTCNSRKTVNLSSWLKWQLKELPVPTKI